MAGVARTAVAEYRARRAVRTLRSFDDLMLRDIGVDRCGIEHAVRTGRDLA
jgi:uncharacterized protein YjiS (DUF1127 family)